MYGWEITADHVNHKINHRMESHRGPGNIPERISTLLAADPPDPMPRGFARWRLYDDDDTCYFEGILYTDEPGSTDEFGPQDDIGEAYGCTYTKILNPETKIWEAL